MADLYLRKGVTRVEASAYMALTPSVVRYAATGLTTDPSGRTRRKNHLFAKISREEVAIRFLEPPPAEILRVAGGERPADGSGGAARRRRSRWRKTSPPRPTPAATPTTAR